MSRMFPLIIRRPTLWSSTSTPFVMAAMSFSAAGEEGDGDIAVALFTFPDEDAYRRYRIAAAEDPEGMAANARWSVGPSGAWSRRRRRTAI